jgi:hypothetical protein
MATKIPKKHVLSITGISRAKLEKNRVLYERSKEYRIRYPTLKNREAIKYCSKGGIPLVTGTKI